MATNFIPFFPLKLVAYPGERLNLHIFEPRYKQLINECVENETPFGIPVFNEQIMDYGAKMRVVEVIKTYPDGEMDISTECIGTFKIIEFRNKVDGKLYSGGIIEELSPIQDQTSEQWGILKRLSKELVKILKMENELDVELISNSFELAHKLGLSLDQEYDMLQMPREGQRQDYMINHLKRAIPMIKEMESAKEKIQMNGHFQHHDPLSF